MRKPKSDSRLLVIAEYLFNQVRDMSDAELTAFYKQCKRVKSNNCEEIIYTASLSMLPFAEEEVRDRRSALRNVNTYAQVMT